MSDKKPQIVDIVREDRFCSSCSANLCGTSVVRETHYDMLLVTCPKCGDTSPVQDIPGLRRTGQRWAGLALAVWMALMAWLWLGGSGLLAGMSMGVTEEACRDLGNFIETKYLDANPGDDEASYDTNVSVIRVAGTQGVKVIIEEQDDDLRGRFAKWWGSQDQQALLAEAGGLSGAIRWLNLWPWALLGLIPLSFGVLWSLCMLNLPRRKFMIAWPVICIWSFLICTSMVVFWNVIPPVSPSRAARSLAGPLVLPVIMTYFSLLLLVGLLSGRSIARWMVKLTMSPKATSKLARLWLTDGLRPPKVSDRTLANC